MRKDFTQPGISEGEVSCPERVGCYHSFSFVSPRWRRTGRSCPISAGSNQRRVALVIGNRDYAQQRLVNPVNDATDLDRTLRGLGFESKLALNLDRRALDNALNTFAATVKPGDTALFYFSGHGMEVDGQNYLLPVDFSAQGEEDAKYQALAAGLVQERLQRRGARAVIMILDACRNNPWKGTRGTGGGLAGMSGSSVYVAFAAAPGSTADDNRAERNGRFTKHLLASIAQPGLSIDDVFNRVRENVATETNGRQVPFSNSGLIGGFFFRPAITAAPVPGAPKADAATEAWALVKDSKSPEDFEDFAKSFPTSDLAATARFRAAQLRRAAATPVTVARVDPPRQPEPQPGDAGRTKVNPMDGLTYVWIEPGTFMMGCSPGDNDCQGSEKPAHPVTITKGFWIGQTPVTQEAYQRVVGTNPSHFKGAKLPMENVTWNESQAYCQKAGMRLPTEAEWEYAARAGTTGSRYGDIDRIAWYSGNSGNKTHEVMQKQPNPWGLYDMLGNAWQWTADWYGDSYYAPARQRDPIGPASGQYRSLRGGSWDRYPEVVRVSGRGGPVGRSYIVGLRCVGN
jgi:formylglycine-generating enzyme required for sulfatase activity